MSPRERISESASGNTLSAPLGTNSSSPLLSSKVDGLSSTKYIPTDVPICTTPSVGQEYEGLLGNGLKTKKLFDVSYCLTHFFNNSPNRQTNVASILPPFRLPSL